MLNLSQLRKGDRAIVVKYQSDCPSSHQLQVLGLVPGTELTVRNPAPFGGSFQIDFRGTSIGLRKHEMQQVQIQKINLS